jgi:hypothetical protein
VDGEFLRKREEENGNINSFNNNLIGKNYMLNYVRSKENLLYDIGKNKKRHKTESESILKCISELSMENLLTKGGGCKPLLTQASEDSDQSLNNINYG